MAKITHSRISPKPPAELLALGTEFRVRCGRGICQERQAVLAPEEIGPGSLQKARSTRSPSFSGMAVATVPLLNSRLLTWADIRLIPFLVCKAMCAPLLLSYSRPQPNSPVCKAEQEINRSSIYLSYWGAQLSCVADSSWPVPVPGSWLCLTILFRAGTVFLEACR